MTKVPTRRCEFVLGGRGTPGLKLTGPRNAEFLVEVPVIAKLANIHWLIARQMRSLQKVTHTPEQLKILRDAGAGFRLIRGAAGSGKTTTAIQRLSQLRRARLSRRARLEHPDPVRILVLTFNRTLRGYINELVTEQANPANELELSLDTFGRWAWHLVGKPNVLEDRVVNSRISDLMREAGLGIENFGYFVDEIQFLLGRFPPSQRDRYLDVDRSGRGRAPAVVRSLRQRLLNNVIEPYETMKAKNSELDWNDIALRAAKVPNQGYDVVIVDETQDFSANQIRAILAHLNQDHSTTFIIDAAQRIYPQVFQWTELDINMRPEMVYSLSRNHRSTAEVARLAASLVRDLPRDADSMLPDEQACDESGQTARVVTGLYSAQIDYMLDEIEPYLDAGETVAILQPRGGGWFDHAKRMLEQRRILYCELTQKREWPAGPELLALSTIHSAKGLEFDHVMMPGLSSAVTPHGAEEGDGALDSIRRLVAMGVGRARKSVILGYKPGEGSTVFSYMDPESYDLIEL